MGRVGVRGNPFLPRAHHRGPQTHAGHGNCCLKDRSLDGFLHGLFVTRKTTGPGASEAAAYRTDRTTERHSGSLPSPVGVDGSGAGVFWSPLAFCVGGGTAGRRHSGAPFFCWSGESAPPEKPPPPFPP